MEPGLLVAYVALGIMAVVPIHFGSFSALKHLPRRKPRLSASHPDYSSSEDEAPTETLSKEDAYWFPIMGSAVLFGLYMVFKLFNKDYINYLLTAYFAVIGVGALTNTLEASIRGISGWKEAGYHIRLVRREKELFHFRFTHLHIASAVFSVGATVYYVLTKNWIMSNLFGLAFATTAIQLIALESFSAGMILLMALFAYDVFWVFGTEVMVSVAKNFDVPIKVLFPRDIYAEKLQFTMLGLGDIVIPGVFLAICLKFDQWKQMKKGLNKMKTRFDFEKTYYTACFTAYVLGLVTTVVVMHTFQAAQPALLYLSPACTLSVIIVAALKGELGLVFQFSTADLDNIDSKAESKEQSINTEVSKAVKKE